MAGDDLGRWAPMPVAEAVGLFEGASFRWWLSGGYALEAHLGWSWRRHDDTDIAINRVDAQRLVEVLDGWDIHVGAAGVLSPWDGGPLDRDRSQNNLWCRPDPRSPWALDVTVGEGDEDSWVYRRDAEVCRPWAEAVLRTPDGVPYLAPEIQLLFKSKHLRPKDDLDAETVIPRLEPERRSWLADHLETEHPWQTLIAGTRARLALGGADVEMVSAGRSSQAWRSQGPHGPRVVRVPIPNSGRLTSYRSEVLIGRLLADRGNPVARWELETVDGVECSLGTLLDGDPVEEHWLWPDRFAAAMATVLRDLHQLPATGWGPLENRTDQLRGTSSTATQGVIDRWFHAPVWPFGEITLESHPITTIAPDLAPRIAALESPILEAVEGPVGVVHSDLHRQHLLRRGVDLAGLLDFGDAFIGSTAWDFGLLRWYYGAINAGRVADSYQPGADLAARGGLLAIAVGCYKVAKTPTDDTLIPRLRSVLDGVA